MFSGVFTNPKGEGTSQDQTLNKAEGIASDTAFVDYI